MRYEPAALEDWMRLYYFSAETDIGSSGVEDYSLAEVRSLLGISHEDLDGIVFRDSTTLGGADVRAAVAGRWGTGDPDRVMITHGASEAIYLVLSTLLDRGDEVIALDPIYHSLTSVARTLSCEIRRWPLRARDGYVPDIDELRSLVGTRTKAIVVNFPHNPTGATLTPGQRDALVAVAADAGAHLVWDQAFRELTYGAAPLRDPVHDYAKAISIGTLSKGYGLPGLRVGWCLADPGVLRRTFELRDRMTLHLSPMVEFLACQVAGNADRLLAGRLAQAERNLATLHDWARDHRDMVEFIAPRGGVCAFPRLRDHADTTELCHRLAREDGVLLVPGGCFGDPGRVRLGFGGPAGELERGLDLLGKALRT